MSAEPNDLLRMDFINSLPQPLWISTFGSEWPVYDIDVETGLLRIDVVGRLDVLHISDCTSFRDSAGTYHDIETLYSDYNPEEEQA